MKIGVATLSQMRAIALLLLLSACASVPPPPDEAPRAITGSCPERWASGNCKTPETAPATVAAEETELKFVLRTECPQCAEKQATLAEVHAERVAALEQHTAWVRKNCKPAARSSVYVANGRAYETSPDLEWVCDGKSVDSTDSVRVRALEDREVYLRGWVRRNCGEEVKKEHRGVGSHYCEP